MNDIKVSIVIPTRNRSFSLKDTITSLCNQSYPSEQYEIIVCDDNSNDDTEDLIKEFIDNTRCNLKYVKVISEIKGPAKVRNAGIEKSLGMIIGFTDDDCILPSNWIETALERFESNEHIVGVYGTVSTLGDCKGSILKIPRKVEVFSDNGSYVTPNIFYRKCVLEKVGYFDLDMRYLQDIELGWRVKKEGLIYFEPNLAVLHKVLCASLKEYLRRQRRVKYWTLMYSKHPEHLKLDTFVFWRVYTKNSFYVIFSLLSIGLYGVQNNLFKPSIILAFVLFLWAHVTVDTKLKFYPLRILLLPKFWLIDLLRLYYSLKASIEYRFFLLY